MTGQRRRAVIGMMAAAMLLAGCAMPRGAALPTEVLRGTDDPANGVQVVEVTRESLTTIAAWPAPRPAVRHNWTSASAAPVARTIRAGDVMNITIWDSQTESLLTTGEQRMVQMQNVPVSASGHIFVPYAGELRVAGMSSEQARRAIEERLVPVVPDGQVQISVSAGTGNTIDVVTGVASPGRQTLPEISPTILSVLAEAGGIAPSLRNPLVRLNRAGVSYAIPARALFSNPAHDIQLRGGDRILVEEDQRSYVALGAAGRQQVVYFERERISALDALSTIGGLSAERANLRGVMVLRQYPESMVREAGDFPNQSEVIFVLDLTSADGLFAAERFEIQPDDVVLATESPMPMFSGSMNVLRAAAQTVRVFN